MLVVIKVLTNFIYIFFITGKNRLSWRSPDEGIRGILLSEGAVGKGGVEISPRLTDA